MTARLPQTLRSDARDNRERILDAASIAGVKSAGYVLLRLPLEVRDLFVEWLEANYPDRAAHVIAQ